MMTDLLSQSGLSLDRLQSFCLVAEAGGVTKAAKGDAARQSQFSRQIKELEEFVGTELLRRSGRGVTLTEAGRQLHTLAREHFAALGDFKADCAREPVRLTQPSAMGAAAPARHGAGTVARRESPVAQLAHGRDRQRPGGRHP